jgi:hypothetical protein
MKELWEQESKLAKQYKEEKKLGLKAAAKATKALHRKTADAILKKSKKK